MKLDGIRVCVLDAYGTLFDAHAAVGHHRPRLADKADAVSAVWRAKQDRHNATRSMLRTSAIPAL